MDKNIKEALEKELKRQNDNIELIASENYVSKSVMELQGSIFTNKYAEGYSGKRYYGGCVNVDRIEDLAIEYVTKLFNVKYANVQPHSGSSANMAVYRALLKPGDVVLGLNLSHGGHLTHGHDINFSGLDYKFIPYSLDSETEMLNYDAIRELALKEKPQMIIAGASAYSRFIDFKKFKEIADEVGALLFVDMAHIAGLVAADLHENPCLYADVVSSTTHKTLRGPRGGIILTNNEEIIKKINKTIFPGIQGGPLMHVIAAKAVCFQEALSDDFKVYQQQIIKNAQALCKGLMDRNIKIVSGGTDNHLMLVDLTTYDLTGKAVEKLMDEAHITCNKNTIPNDPKSPFVTSGIRLGTPAVTSRGMKEADMDQVAEAIAMVIKQQEDGVAGARAIVQSLTDKYPLCD